VHPLAPSLVRIFHQPPDGYRTSVGMHERGCGIFDVQRSLTSDSLSLSMISTELEKRFLKKRDSSGTIDS
jgi:hypothetical protein